MPRQPGNRRCRMCQAPDYHRLLSDRKSLLARTQAVGFKVSPYSTPSSRLVVEEVLIMPDGITGHPTRFGGRQAKEILDEEIEVPRLEGLIDDPLPFWGQIQFML